MEQTNTEERMDLGQDECKHADSEQGGSQTGLIQSYRTGRIKDRTMQDMMDTTSCRTEHKQNKMDSGQDECRCMHGCMADSGHEVQ